MAPKVAYKKGVCKKCREEDSVLVEASLCFLCANDVTEAINENPEEIVLYEAVPEDHVDDILLIFQEAQAVSSTRPFDAGITIQNYVYYRPGRTRRNRRNPMGRGYLRKLRRSMNQCYACGGQKPCEQCRIKSREKRLGYLARKRADGCCLSCGIHAGGKRYCLHHRELRKKYRRLSYHNKKGKGICTKCSCPAIVGEVFCELHKKKQPSKNKPKKDRISKKSAISREMRLIAAGICIACGKIPNDNGKRRCLSCSEKNSRCRMAAYYRKLETNPPSKDMQRKIDII